VEPAQADGRHTTVFGNSYSPECKAVTILCSLMDQTVMVMDIVMITDLDCCGCTGHFGGL
jgi:hypothetical protein